MGEAQPAGFLQNSGLVNAAITNRRAATAHLSGEGVGDYNGDNDFKVTEDSPTGMSVLVARGVAYVQGDDTTDQGMYNVYNGASKQVVLASADLTNPRKDIIILRVQDAYEGGAAGDTWLIDKVTGAPAGTPGEPTLPPSSLKLAVITVLANATSVTNTNIADSRPRVGAKRLIVPRARVYLTSDEPITNNGELLAWDIAEFDNAAFWSSGAATRLTVAAAGVYDVGAQVTFASDGAGTYRAAFIRKNGSDRAANQRTQIADPGFATGKTEKIQVFDMNEECVIGDYFELYPDHNKGTALDAKLGAAITWMAIKKVG